MKKLIFLTLLLLALIGITFYINSVSHMSLFPSTAILGVTPTPSPLPPSTKTPMTKVVEVSVKKNAISGNSTIQIPQNSFLVLEVTSDKADILELEGYNKKVTLLKGTKVILSFPVVTAGSFKLSLQSTGKQIGTLNVQ